MTRQMVSKLLLAVQECCLRAIDDHADPKVSGRLLEHFYEIEAGIGVHKSPALYGAFPTDPYSHTPQHRGAQQPGMTGQVKEDILTRMEELGAGVKHGRLSFQPRLLRKGEFLREEDVFTYLNTERMRVELPLGDQSLAFTYCQVPVIYRIADAPGLAAYFKDGKSLAFEGMELDEETSRHIFNRTGQVSLIEVAVPAEMLKD